MSEKIIVTCDSTCDLSPELYEKYEIQPVALGTILGEEMRRDGVDVTPLEIFDYVGKTGVLPKTSAVSVAEYTDVFKKYVDSGCEIVHINISSEFSSCYQNACIAAEELGHVYPVDSRNLSTGSGHLAIKARELAQDGLSASEIADKLNGMKEKLDVSFVLQTLDYLQKGGRCSGVVAFGANLLKLRPEIVVSEGTMIVGKKYRGSMEKSILDYVRGRLADRSDIDTSRIFITHSHVPDDIVAKVRSLVKELQPFEDENILETYAGCTVSCHCGPNCLGVLFFKK
ncbi:MAG: DegV family protein [Oscillospiraceae bacterium]|nr:DegV family protein [Oscillospiraceae bacterium]